jgi:hypothetical protein
MIQMVADVAFIPNDRGDALGGPDLSEKPEGFGTPGEQIGRLCELLGSQPGVGPGGSWLCRASAPPSRARFSHWLTAPLVTPNASAMAVPFQPC